MELDLIALKRKCEASEERIGKVKEAAKILVNRMNRREDGVRDEFSRGVQASILPLLEQLKSLGLDSAQTLVVRTLEFNLHHMMSRLNMRPVKQKEHLSPREAQVCRLLGNGMKTRQIAASLGLTPDTVLVHRKNIRRKLGLSKKKVNLETYIRENWG
jgi:DNA-binding CsgD family transcriptional regulator